VIFKFEPCVKEITNLHKMQARFHYHNSHHKKFCNIILKQRQN